MKKLSLKLDDLAVESFSTVREKKDGGTVRGHEYTDVYDSCVATACGTSCQYDTKCGSHAMTCGDGSGCAISEPCYSDDPHRC